MAMTIGELVGYIRADDSAFRRGVNRAQAGMERLRDTTAARLRDMRERFVSESRDMADAMADSVADATQEATASVERFTRDARGRLRNSRGHFVSEAAAIAQGFTEAVQNGADDGMTGFVATIRRHLRRLRGDVDGESRSLWSRLISRGHESGEESGHGAGRGFLRSFARTMRSGIGNAFQAGLSGLQSVTGQSNPYIAAVVLSLVTAIGAALGPAIAGVIGGLIVAGAGIGMIGLSALLVKDEPKVKQAATRLTSTAKRVFQSAAQPMVQPISDALGSLEKSAKSVGPKLREAFKALGDSGATSALTSGIDQLVKKMLPGLISMLQKSKPVFEGLSTLLGRIGAGLGKMFSTIGSGSPAMGQALADLGWLLEKTLSGIGFFISGLAQMYTKVRPFIVQVIGLFEWLYNVLVGHSIIPDLVNAIVGFLASLPGRAAAVLSGLPGAIISRAQDAATRARAAIQSGVDSAVRTLSSLPGRARGALAGLGGTLYSAGQTLINGLISGIYSKFQSVRSALSSLTSMLPDWKGPAAVDAKILAPAGRSVIEGFQRGIAGATPGLRNQLGGLTGALPGMALPGGRGSAAAAPQPAPTRVIVEVRGPEEVVRLIRTAVAKNGGDVQKYLGNKK
ncbi:hypothetical protein [Streptomyces sp. NPDC101132]|uniref:phage tail protein n=1 Tax=Streptomyces sp. NPDC101132 TaxID=3366110 RepID=UPI00382F3710